MTGKELLRKLKRLGMDRGIVVNVINHGKGSHSTIYYGDRRTIFQNPKKELNKGVLSKMLKDLGLELSDL